MVKTETKLKSLLVSNIERIFALDGQRRLFSLRHSDVDYEEADDHELTRCYQLWEDPMYLFDFYDANPQDLPQNSYYGKVSKEDFAQRTYEQAQRIRQAVDQVIADPMLDRLSELFQPLRDDHEHKLLTKVKLGGWLRLYGVRMRTDQFFIVGGAIKLNHLMKERDHLERELDRMMVARQDLSKLIRAGELFTLVV
ncbi:hypothetical protein [Neolewinella sp.]|uniref:hypothetical protein n=1 Tax=Neolewinella sp. TaxID=2993543 RepID=UPI003B51BABD